MKYAQLQDAVKSLGCFTAIVISVGLLAGGCTSITRREYMPFVRDLDGKNELYISTYPAGYPKKTSGVPLVYKRLATHDHVYFKVHVRDIDKKAGPNPHVESIRIHSFSYHIGDQPKTELISGYDSNFWMQGQPQYDKLSLPAVPYHPDAAVQIEITFRLNGQEYAYTGEMPPSEHTAREPFLSDLRR